MPRCSTPAYCEGEVQPCIYFAVAQGSASRFDAVLDTQTWQRARYSARCSPLYGQYACPQPSLLSTVCCRRRQHLLQNHRDRYRHLIPYCNINLALQIDHVPAALPLQLSLLCNSSCRSLTKSVALQALGSLKLSVLSISAAAQLFTSGQACCFHLHLAT